MQQQTSEAERKWSSKAAKCFASCISLETYISDLDYRVIHLETKISETIQTREAEQ